MNITREQYIEAVQTVIDYKKQISEQFQEVKKELEKHNLHKVDFEKLIITPETPIYKTSLSGRTQTIIISNLTRIKDREISIEATDEEREYEWSYSYFKIKHLQEFTREELYDWRMVGNKVIIEIEEMFFGSGMTLKIN
jgi:hypothetical protein